MVSMSALMLDGRPGVGCLRLGVPEVVRVDLVGEVALVLAGERVLGIDARLPDVRIGRGVGLYLVARPAHQLVDRRLERPAGEIPERVVDDARDVLRDVGDPQPLPDHLAVERILADEQRS